MAILKLIVSRFLGTTKVSQPRANFFCQHSPKSKTIANNNKTKNKKKENADFPINIKAVKAATVNINKFSEKGISFFCYHGFPLRSSLVPMVSAEQFCYYLSVLRNIIKERKLKCFGMDTNNKFSKYVKKREPILPDNDIKYVTAKMHGPLHIESFREAFLSIYIEGIGRLYSSKESSGGKY